MFQPKNENGKFIEVQGQQETRQSFCESRTKRQVWKRIILPKKKKSQGSVIATLKFLFEIE